MIMSVGIIFRIARMSILLQMSLIPKTANISTRSENERMYMIVFHGDLHSKMLTNLWQYEVVPRALSVVMQYGLIRRGCTIVSPVYDVMIVSDSSDLEINHFVFLIGNIAKVNMRNLQRKSYKI